MLQFTAIYHSSNDFVIHSRSNSSYKQGKWSETNVTTVELSIVFVLQSLISFGRKAKEINKKSYQLETCEVVSTRMQRRTICAAAFEAREKNRKKRRRKPGKRSASSPSYTKNDKKPTRLAFFTHPLLVCACDWWNQERFGVLMVPTCGNAKLKFARVTDQKPTHSLQTPQQHGRLPVCPTAWPRRRPSRASHSASRLSSPPLAPLHSPPIIGPTRTCALDKPQCGR